MVDRKAETEFDLDKFNIAVKELVEQGLSICKFAKEHEIGYLSLRKYLKCLGLFDEWKNNRYWSRSQMIKRSYIEESIKKNLTLREIAAHEGISPQGVRSYLINHGLYETWRNHRDYWVRKKND